MIGLRQPHGNGSLADLGIGLRDERPGEHRAPCPRCAETKLRHHDTALAVKVDADGGAVWVCHRCAWTGALGADRQHEHRPLARPAAPEPDRKAAGIAATALWRSTLPITADCAAGRYLLARGCALPHVDGDLRWLPDHRHPCGHVGPALVALVTDAVTAEPLTVHRTWIRPDGTKAPVERPRLLWPGLPKAGGVCRLWPDDEVTLGLLVAEGIETALSAARGFGLGWATIDAANLASLPVLPGIDALTIIADADRPDQRGRRAGEAAAIACARRWRDAVVEARVWLPDGEGIDFADLAQDIAA